MVNTKSDFPGSAGLLSEAEALLRRRERRPGQLATLTLLAMLDSMPRWDRFRAVHERAIGSVPHSRDRLVGPALPVGPPAWVPDGRFDLDHHLRRVRLPAPGSRAQLLALARDAAMTPFDCTRPLWEVTLVGGLPHGKAAYLLKVHHALTGPGDAPVARPRLQELPADPWWLALQEFDRQALTSPLTVARLLVDGAYAVTHPGPALAASVRLAAGLRHAAVPPVPASPLFDGRTGASWQVGLLKYPLGRLRMVARATGSSFEAVIVAALLGGMRRYHHRHGIDLGELSVVLSGDGSTTGAVFAGPAGVADPQERIAVLHGLMLTSYVERMQSDLSTLTPLLNRLPATVIGAASKILTPADLRVSSSAAIASATRWAGVTVQESYLLSPPAGSAVTVAYREDADTCRLGLTMDATVVPDPDCLVASVGEGFDEVLALNRVV